MLKEEQKRKSLDLQQTRRQTQEEALQQARGAVQQQTWQHEEAQEEAQEEALRQAEQLSRLQRQADLGTANAGAAAAGEPVQQQIPARNTYKARRAARKAEKLHAKEAEESTEGVGNIVTYDMQHQLKDYSGQLANSYENYFASHSNLSGVDDGVLQFFSHGFRTNKEGRPATADDEKYKLEDAAFYEAFCSEDYEKRAPYLQQMVEEVLSLNLNDTFSDKSMRSNAAGMRSIAGRLVSMQNVVADEHNAFFFDKLSPEKRAALDRAMDIGASYSAAFTAECHRRGVDTKGSYIKSKDKIETYSAQEKDYTARYQKKLEPYQPVGAIKRAALRRNSRIDAGDIWEALSAERPAPGIYQQIRGLLEPDVQKLLDCKVEDLRALSDKNLRQLYAASLDVDKCLTLKHPERQKLTLQEDLIGQRKLEYEYKSAVLRGLVEKADGFKKQGKQTIKAASALYRKQMKPGTKECQEFFGYISKKHNLQELIIVDPKFDAVKKEFYAGTGDLAEAPKRLKNIHYFSLDEEKRIKLNKPVDIGEALFRSLDSFLSLEATHTLLTPEQFKQMLLDLGAGAGLTPRSPEEERKPAIEKNNAGLDTLREVMAAQYEMLERKYGNSIEQLTIQDIMEHFMDIAKDFANIQVDLHMTKNFPGFIRENNPDDERLDKQIRYYNECAFQILDLVTEIGGEFIEAKEVYNEMLKDKFRNIFEHPRNEGLRELRDVRAALMENNSFQHPMDWSQRVKGPVT